MTDSSKSTLPTDIPCGLMDVGSDNHVLGVNAKLADWLGYDADALLGRDFGSLVSMGARIAYETHIRPMLRLEGRVEELALDLIHADGTRVPFIANARLSHDADGEALSTRFALFRAVDRRTYERTLRDARQMAEEAAAKEADVTALRDRVIAVLGHDLRNPLASIHSGINVIERRDSKPAPDILTAMRHSLDRAVALIDGVMDFARASLGGGMRLSRKERPDLGERLERIVEETRLTAPDRDIQSRWNITHPVSADIDRLSQLLANLLSNALHHGDDDGSIRVEGTTTQSVFRLTVINRGTEIPQDVCARLFEPFVQGESSHSGRGLGLGLYIVSQIAQAHDGEIDVQCGDGDIVFAFEMPRQESLPKA